MATGLIIVVIVFVGIYVISQNMEWRKFIPDFNKALDFIKTSITYWGYKEKYDKYINTTVQYLNLIYVLSMDENDLRKSRSKVQEFVSATYKSFYPKEEDLENKVRVAMAGYMLLLSHAELKETIDSLKDHKNLEVKKATYIAIDTLGELFDLKEDLNQEYFQHLIYGLNKCFVLFKKKGAEEKNIKEIIATLWRVYSLTKAYKKLSGSKELTLEEFYAKTTDTFNTLFRMFGV